MNKKLIVFTLYIFSICACRSVHSSSDIHRVIAEEGYIDFKIKINQAKLEKFRDNLSFGKRDTCFVYYNMSVFKNFTLEFDSLSYECLCNKKLDTKKLEEFGRSLKPRIVDKSNSIITFEPFNCAIQFSLEVGQTKSDKVNGIFIGYSKTFNFKR